MKSRAHISLITTPHSAAAHESCIPFAKRFLMQEASSIQSVADFLDERFDDAVALLCELPAEGRVITIGMGKTGIIGEKLSASLASVGFPSFPLHPADATHGDLGRVTPSDLVLLLSNNGATSELVRLLPSLTALGCKTIAISANPESPLARHATVFVSLPKLDEAGPLGLAPTSSAVALLALGDALIMSAVSRRGLTAEDFAKRHPGGLLGRALCKVREVMRSGDALCIVLESTTCRQALHQITLTRGKPGCAGVVNASGEVCGIFTDGDLRRCLDRSAPELHASVDFLDRPISEVMGKNPKCIGPEALAQEALTIMKSHQIDQLLVIDEQKKPLGLIDIQDIVQVG
jgi:arabinose-5-phosphate isomerase